jgi:hypothetical protein
MKRIAVLALVGLTLAACEPSATWGPGLMHWSNPNGKLAQTTQAAAEENFSDNAMVGEATEADTVQEDATQGTEMSDQSVDQSQSADADNETGDNSNGATGDGQ